MWVISIESQLDKLCSKISKEHCTLPTVGKMVPRDRQRENEKHLTMKMTIADLVSQHIYSLFPGGTSLQCD